MSNLGQNLKIEHAMDSCECTRKTFLILLFSYVFFPLAPIICIAGCCYYSSNPEIQISKHIIQGTLCPKCKTGKIKYAMIADGSCTDARKKELFIFVQIY